MRKIILHIILMLLTGCHLICQIMTKSASYSYNNIKN